MMSKSRRKRAFTLVEILIVVVILGILAAVVVPQFAGAADEARAGNLQSQIRSIQEQIELYRARTGSYPSLAELQADPTDAGTDWGPLVDNNYLKSSPVNPVNGQSAVADEAGEDVGWVYDEATGQVTATYFNEDTNAITTTP